MAPACNAPWRRAMFAETLSWPAIPDLTKKLDRHANPAEVAKLRNFLLYCHQTDYDCIERTIRISTRDHDHFMATARFLRTYTYINYGEVVMHFTSAEPKIRARYFASIVGPSAALGISQDYVRLQILAYAGHRVLWSSYRSTMNSRKLLSRMRGLAQKLWQDKNITFPALRIPEDHELYRRLTEIANRYFVYLQDVCGSLDSVWASLLTIDDRAPLYCLNILGRKVDCLQARLMESADQRDPLHTKCLELMFWANYHSLMLFDRARQVREWLRRVAGGECRNGLPYGAGDGVAFAIGPAGEWMVVNDRPRLDTELPPPYTERPLLDAQFSTLNQS